MAEASGAFVVRRVVADGDSKVVSDGPPPVVATTQGVDIAELWRVEGGLRSAADGGEPGEPWELIPWPGGLAWRIVRFKSSSPDLHTTDTLDLVAVVDGEIDLVLEAGPVRLGPGDSVVIQDAPHGWRLVDEQPCTVVAMMLRPAQGAGR